MRSEGIIWLGKGWTTQQHLQMYCQHTLINLILSFTRAKARLSMFTIPRGNIPQVCWVHGIQVSTYMPEVVCMSQACFWSVYMIIMRWNWFTPLHTVKCRESLIIEGQMMNLPTKQISIIASNKKRAHGKLQKDVQVSWTHFVLSVRLRAITMLVSPSC